MIIPFFISHAGCPHQCVFCDQKSITGQRAPVDPASIPRTVAGHLKTGKPGERVQIAFFGGSFTSLPAETQTAYLKAAEPFIASGTVESIRLSTRPDAVTAPILDNLKRHYVRTIELGAQSMNDRVLSLSGRGHTAADTATAMAHLKAYGFETGLQLMLGLPGDMASTFRDTVDNAVSLGPDFVRLYPLLVIKGTPLEVLYRRGDYRPLPLKEAVELCSEAAERFEQAGIKVIRTGLQQTGALASGAVVAGPWHPAFGQLVASSRYLTGMRNALRSSPGETGSATVRVHEADISTAIGQKRSNIAALEREFGLRDLRILPDPKVRRGEVRIMFSAD